MFSDLGSATHLVFRPKERLSLSRQFRQHCHSVTREMQRRSPAKKLLQFASVESWHDIFVKFLESESLNMFRFLQGFQICKDLDSLHLYAWAKSRFFNA